MLRFIGPAAAILLAAAGAGCANRAAERDAALRASAEPPTDPSGLRRRLAVPGLRDAVGNRQEIADRIGAVLMDELGRGGHLLLTGPDRLGPAAEDGRGIGGLPAADWAEAGKRAAVELVLVGTLTQFQVEARQSSFSLPLPGIPVPVPGLPGLPGIPINSSKVKVALTIEGRLVDSATGRVLFTGRGRAEREGKTGGIFPDGREESVELGLLTEAVRDLLSKLYPRLAAQPWTAMVTQVNERGVFLNAGSSAGLAVGRRFDLLRPGIEGIDPADGLFKPAREDTVGRIELIEVGERFAIGKPVGGEAVHPGDLARPTAAQPPAPATP